MARGKTAQEKTKTWVVIARLLIGTGGLVGAVVALKPLLPVLSAAPVATATPTQPTATWTATATTAPTASAAVATATTRVTIANVNALQKALEPLRIQLTMGYEDGPVIARLQDDPLFWKFANMCLKAIPSGLRLKAFLPVDEAYDQWRIVMGLQPGEALPDSSNVDPASVKLAFLLTSRARYAAVTGFEDLLEVVTAPTETPSPTHTAAAAPTDTATPEPTNTLSPTDIPTTRPTAKPRPPATKAPALPQAVLLPGDARTAEGLLRARNIELTCSQNPDDVRGWIETDPDYRLLIEDILQLIPEGRHIHDRACLDIINGKFHTLVGVPEGQDVPDSYFQNLDTVRSAIFKAWKDLHSGLPQATFDQIIE